MRPAGTLTLRPRHTHLHLGALTGGLTNVAMPAEPAHAPDDRLADAAPIGGTLSRSKPRPWSRT